MPTHVSPHHLPPIPQDLTVPQFLLDTPSPAPAPLRAHRSTPSSSLWLLDDATGRTYALPEIRQRVECLARALRARWALGGGDVVCLYSGNHVDYPIVIWALHRLGASVTCANPSYTSSELEYQLRATQARLVFTAPASLEVARAALAAAGGGGEGDVVIFSPPPPEGPALPANAPPSDRTVQHLVYSGSQLSKNYIEPSGASAGSSTAFLGFSSGTTGLPKSVTIAHRNVLTVLLQMSVHFRAHDAAVKEEDKWVRPGDRALAVLPFYHIYGLVAVLHALLYAGAGIVIIPQFHPQQFLETIVRRRITHLPLVPPIIHLLVKSPMTKNYDLSHLHWVTSGAAPLPSPVLEQFRALLPRARIGEGYGLTETSTLVSSFDMHQPPIAGSVGFLVSDTQARIVQPNGEDAPPGSPGEIWVKGPQMALGYSNDRQASEETFLPDGWVRTGDEGYFGQDGSLYIVDRIKELIKVSGFQVAPAELEGHLLLHPYVQDAGVVRIPDESKGEVPIAFVVLNEPVALRAASATQEADDIRQELRKWVSEHKVRYKHLDGGVVFVERIPKNPSGKILRRLLRELAETVVVGRQ
ncbi:phenylacetyl-CoA ligase [Calocera viscosa TUFC12733]|uniref:Phenylacetyl-CoA ligase n=1 Tax=Calocera viscosa (strain TUFC12733) TaxID=1330018 RepID=A0A167IEQ0_CALVF|nr:phenylacetyl-CoA ligase [Calocera viscosa TUFC12733]